jgi:hypothetical protein
MPRGRSLPLLRGMPAADYLLTTYTQRTLPAYNVRVTVRRSTANPALYTKLVAPTERSL